MREFEATTYGKWILAGEHSVLRGVPALVFPVYDCSLKVKLVAADTPLDAEFTGRYGEELRLLFWSVMEKALEPVGHQRSELSGKLHVENNLAIGAGLGASAAICVCIGRWWMAQGWIDESELYEFSRRLENLFHGESSGVDIAASLTGNGLRFLRNGEWSPIKVAWQPNWYLSYSGQKGVTSECVGKVKALLNREPKLGAELDEQMYSAVRISEKALSLGQEDGLPLLVDGINLALNCFERWGLTEGRLADHMAMLKDYGALAYKPTGSGGGGYVLSLWNTEPPKELKDLFISLNPPA